jgi:hypothetical protein
MVVVGGARKIVAISPEDRGEHPTIFEHFEAQVASAESAACDAPASSPSGPATQKTSFPTHGGPHFDGS